MSLWLFIPDSTPLVETKLTMTIPLWPYNDELYGCRISFVRVTFGCHGAIKCMIWGYLHLKSYAAPPYLWVYCLQCTKCKASWSLVTPKLLMDDSPKKSNWILFSTKAAIGCLTLESSDLKSHSHKNLKTICPLRYSQKRSYHQRLLPVFPRRRVQSLLDQQGLRNVVHYPFSRGESKAHFRFWNPSQAVLHRWWGLTCCGYTYVTVTKKFLSIRLTSACVDAMLICVKNVLRRRLRKQFISRRLIGPVASPYLVWLDSLLFGLKSESCSGIFPGPGWPSARRASQGGRVEF
jgi:hypothetical protein